MHNVYERYGRVAHSAQNFEWFLASIWMYLEVLSKGWPNVPPNKKQVAELIQGMEKKTLGKLLEKVDQLLSMDDTAVRESFQEAWKVRNSLAHGFFTAHGLVQDIAEDAAQKMTNELVRAEHILSTAEAFSSRILGGLMKLKADLDDPARREAIVNEGFANLAAKTRLN